MEFKTHQSGKVEIVELKGRLDLAGAEVAEKFFQNFIENEAGEKNLLVDFSEVEYINSSGLRVLASASNEIQKRGGSMALCNLNVGVEEVFHFSGLDSTFRIYKNQDAALKALS